MIIIFIKIYSILFFNQQHWKIESSRRKINSANPDPQHSDKTGDEINVDAGSRQIPAPPA
jgi:hypothetical protein